MRTIFAFAVVVGLLQNIGRHLVLAEANAALQVFVAQAGVVIFRTRFGVLGHLELGPLVVNAFPGAWGTLEEVQDDGVGQPEEIVAVRTNTDDVQRESVIDLL